MTYRIEGSQIVREYVTEDGGAGIHMIPLRALAYRMALLNLDDPGQALDVVLDEESLVPSNNPYAVVYQAMAEGDPEPVEAFREALDAMPTVARCDGRHEAEFKDYLRTEFGEQINAARWQFVAENTKDATPLGPGGEQPPES